MNYSSSRPRYSFWMFACSKRGFVAAIIRWLARSRSELAFDHDLASLCLSKVLRDCSGQRSRLKTRIAFAQRFLSHSACSHIYVSHYHPESLARYCLTHCLNRTESWVVMIESDAWCYCWSEIASKWDVDYAYQRWCLAEMNGFSPRGSSLFWAELVQQGHSRLSADFDYAAVSQFLAEARYSPRNGWN